MHPQSIVDATVYGQCLEYLGYITLSLTQMHQSDWEMLTDIYVTILPILLYGLDYTFGLFE